MDDLLNENFIKPKPSISPAGVYFIGLSAILGIFSYIGVKLAENSSELSDLSFYDRYANASAAADLPSLFRQFADAVHNSVPNLIQTAVLFVLSFSPLLLPAGIITVAVRGIIAGTAFCNIGSTAETVQLGIYLAVSLVICFLCSAFVSHRKNTDVTDLRSVIKRSVIFLASSGACVFAEFALSFIL